MRIAQVAPLYESCPPQLYGGTERVVSYLTEELVRQGHEVTLFASGDSQTRAVLQAPCERALRLDPQCRDALPYHFIALHRLMRSVDAFDIIRRRTCTKTRSGSTNRTPSRPATACAAPMPWRF